MTIDVSDLVKIRNMAKEREMKTDSVNFFGAKIREKREKLNITQRELAAQAGISKEGITKIERGDRGGNAITIKKIAVALGGDLILIFNDQ
ncbi:helix-turn-helix transcriptional regulator [Niveispirillum sp. BGYR6]|uniref:helix-turn-helix domain-containing protein n=1 Tax=Niveispirillum sp. BGYR6 TaxID=2971249 RepID=UPI0022B982AD|nr:helix-turn-helix transcriptional regulator [Niveispirillum sp. BGYR6]MDG5496950.1 helix-turn-helix transcriptional regulator [Niveispirillum sp. BGYR6]